MSCCADATLIFFTLRGGQRDAVLAARLVPARRGSAPPGPMKSFTNEGADRHAGAPGPALPPDAAHEGGAGNARGAATAATHEGGAADDPAGAAPPAEAAPLLAAAEIPAAATAEEESQPRTRRPRPDDGQRVGTWRTARRGNQMYSSSCTLLDLRAGTEERQYVTEVILRFGEGRLPNVPDNTSLRVLLSTVLNCSPMRITKKFSGRNALPRGRYRRTAAPEPAAVWKSNFGRPTPSTRRAFRSCVCAMAWRFHAIDATLSPWPRRLDGVEAHEGPRNISQDNLTPSTRRDEYNTGNNCSTTPCSANLRQ